MSSTYSPPYPYFNGINYNSQFFTASSQGLTQSQGDIRYLGRTGNPTSIATNTIFTGQITTTDLSVSNVIQGTALNATNATNAVNATNATNAYSNNTNTNGTYYLTFTSDNTSNYSTLQKSGAGADALTYNPSTNTLTAYNINAINNFQQAGTSLDLTYASLYGGNQFVGGINQFYNSGGDVIQAYDNTTGRTSGFVFMNNVGSIGYYTGSVINWSIAYDGTATIPRPIFPNNIGITATATYLITSGQSGYTFYIYGNTATAFTLPSPTNNKCFYIFVNGNSSNAITITCATNGGFFLPYSTGTQTISIPINTTTTIRCDGFNWLLIESSYRQAQLASINTFTNTNNFQGITATSVALYGQYLNYPAPPISTTSSLSTLNSNYYDIYPINATATITITLPAPTFAISGMTFQFRRINTSAVAITSSPSFYPITGTTLTTALLTASTTTQDGFSIKLMCVLTSGTTYNYYQIA